MTCDPYQTVSTSTLERLGKSVAIAYDQSLFKVGPDGALTNKREEPIAADARPEHDGTDVAKLKVVAGLLGLGLDEIVRRAERARRKRVRNWSTALLLLTVTFAELAVWAEINRREAEFNWVEAETQRSHDRC